MPSLTNQCGGRTTRHLSLGAVTHELLQQTRRGTNARNPNAGKLSDKLQEQNRKPTLPPESRRDERLTVRTWCPFMFFLIGIMSDACAVGLGRALRADRTLALYSHLYWKNHVMHVPNSPLYTVYWYRLQILGIDDLPKTIGPKLLSSPT